MCSDSESNSPGETASAQQPIAPGHETRVDGDQTAVTCEFAGECASAVVGAAVDCTERLSHRACKTTLLETSRAVHEVWDAEHLFAVEMVEQLGAKQLERLRGDDVAADVRTRQRR